MNTRNSQVSGWATSRMLPAIDSPNFKPLDGFSVGFIVSQVRHITSELVGPPGLEPGTKGL